MLKRSKTITRRLFTESLENRTLFAADVHFLEGTLAIYGDNSADHVEVTSESDTLQVHIATNPAGDQTHTFNLQQVRQIVFRGGDGDDIYTSNANINMLIYGDDGDDSLTGGIANDRIFSGAGNDTINGNDGDDYAYSASGDDTIDGGDGNDRLNGGYGNDSIDGGWGDDTVYGSVGDDIVRGGWGNDRIFGHNGNDEIYGGGICAWREDCRDYADDDFLYGGNGDDIMDGIRGHDEVYGQNDNDTLISRWNSGVLDGGNGDDHLEKNSYYRDAYRIYYWGEIEFRGGDGDDTIHGGYLNDQIWGGAGNDTIYGSRGNDRIWAEDGDDFVSGGRGNDRIIGGDGDDELHGFAGNDVIFGDAGRDTIYGETSAEFDYYDNHQHYRAFFENHPSSDSLYGGDDDDLIHGGMSTDIVYGGRGNDELYGDGIIGRNFSWTAYMPAFQQTRYNGDEVTRSWILGDPTDLVGDDWVVGGDGDDVLVGGWGLDRLYGNNGRDTIFSHLTPDEQPEFLPLPDDGVQDTMSGGADQDTFHRGIQDRLTDYNRFVDRVFFQF